MLLTALLALAGCASPLELSSDRVIEQQTRSGDRGYLVVTRPRIYDDDFCVSRVQGRHGVQTEYAVFLRADAVECRAIAARFDEHSASREPFGDRLDALHCSPSNIPVRNCERAALWVAEVSRQYHEFGIEAVEGRLRDAGALDVFFSAEGRLMVNTAGAFNERLSRGECGFFTKVLDRGFVHVMLCWIDGNARVIRVETNIGS